MTLENKFARLMRNTGPARFFIPVGVILIIFGIILLSFNTAKYVETTGKITSVEKLQHEEGEAQAYEVKAKYTVNGTEYETTLSNLTGEFKEGDDIKIFYDPMNPEKATNSKISGFIGPVVIVVGAAATVYGIAKTVSAYKKSKELDASVPGGGSFPSAEFEGFKQAYGVTEYYFRFDGNSLKPGYVIEDADRKIVFEGKMTKQALIGSREYEFRNALTGEAVTHEVGHVMTQSYNDEFFSAKSWFKFDGKNVWDVIHERGIRISTNLHSKFPHCIYDIAQNGKPFVRVESCGVYVHEEDEAQHKINVPTGSMYYRLWTGSDDFDSVFLTIFAISESEQAVVE